MPSPMPDLSPLAQATAPLQQVVDELTEQAGVELWVKRLDLLHPEVSGNKWYKLKHNLAEAQAQGHHTLLTFGGAYSNHLYATAAAGRLFGFRTIGLVRGEPALPLNPTLQFVQDCGMELAYVDRATYRAKADPAYLASLRKVWGDFYLLPEGGGNALAVLGCAEILADLPHPLDVVACACGTGCTLAGLLASPPAPVLQSTKFLGFPVLKGGEFLAHEVEKLLAGARVGTSRRAYELVCQYHFGGYAKTTPALLGFMDWFMAQHPIRLEPVYTGKLFYGVYDLLGQGHFPPGSRVLLLHTGGLRP
jgi:1-aminocyclopropane-1-carboxylate deaminase